MNKGRTLLAGFIIALGLGGSDSLHAADYYVCVANDATVRYEVYDPAVGDWNSSTALKWSFKPTTANGWTSAEVAAYSNPSDMKLRWSGSNQVVVSCASGGLATIATYPGGVMKWTRDVGGSNNPHAVELLPNGNIAVAASDGGWVRVYAASQSNRNSTYAQFNDSYAHGVLWDPDSNVLWVLGYYTITALSVGGTAANPTLTEIVSRRADLPSTGGHDLSAYWGDTDKLWITTGGGVYIYNKTAKTFTSAPGSANRTAVKGCSNQPSGEIVETKPSSACGLSTWCTPYVNFYTASGASDYTRTRTGAAFYKCRVFYPDYQPALPSPAVVALGTNQIAMLMRGVGNDALYYRLWTNGTWSGWTSLGGHVLGNPAVSSWAPDRMDVFARGTDRAIYQRTWNGSTWTAYASLGGVLTSDPGAVSWGTNRIDLFAQGTDGNCWHKNWNGSSWSGWSSIGGPILGGPAVSSWGVNRLDVFARGADIATYHSTWDGASWSASWQSLNGRNSGNPGAVSWGVGQINVLIRGGDGAVWQDAGDGVSWSGFTSLGGNVVNGPGVCSRAPNTLDVFILGTDRHVWAKSWDGATWSSWTDTGAAP